MIDGTVEYIMYLRTTMQPDEWLDYLESLRAWIDKRIEEASTGEELPK